MIILSDPWQYIERHQIFYFGTLKYFFVLFDVFLTLGTTGLSSLTILPSQVDHLILSITSGMNVSEADSFGDIYQTCHNVKNAFWLH